MQRTFEFLAIRLAKRRVRAVIDDPVQFVQIYVDPLPRLLHHRPNNSRKRGVNGKPNNSFAGCVRFLVGAL